jgi:Cof subfamily protein (haloacid dehalogenase superfamily)
LVCRPQKGRLINNFELYLKMYKIIFIDIDGTLLTSDHKISAGTLSTIQRVNQFNKIPIILTSARPPKAIQKIYYQLGLNAPVVCFNGALLIKMEDTGNYLTLNSHTIPTFLLKQTHAIAAMHHVSLSIYTSSQWYSNNYDKWIKQEEKITKTNAVILNTPLQLNNWQTANDAPHKILLMGEPDKIESISLRLKKHTGNKLNIYKSKPCYLEIINSSASKTSAVIFLLQQYGLTQKDVLAIGDNYNDAEMLEFAGMGIAMANAPDEVKARAQFVTLNNDADGVKFALDKFIK